MGCWSAKPPLVQPILRGSMDPLLIVALFLFMGGVATRFIRSRGARNLMWLIEFALLTAAVVCLIVYLV